ncbi:MAG: hypothetical protein WC294_08020 [Methanoregula sp.]|jgi:hypothetical protein
MKKILVALMVLLVVSVAWASDQKKIGVTADGAITTSGGYLKGLIVHTDGANAVTIALYDNASAASGSKLFSDLVVTSGASDRTTTLSFDFGDCEYFNGMYLDMTTAGSATIDFYFFTK